MTEAFSDLNASLDTVERMTVVCFLHDDYLAQIKPEVLRACFITLDLARSSMFNDSRCANNRFLSRTLDLLS